jgi:hypothetical protein
LVLTGFSLAEVDLLLDEARESIPEQEQTQDDEVPAVTARSISLSLSPTLKRCLPDMDAQCCTGLLHERGNLIVELLNEIGYVRIVFEPRASDYVVCVVTHPLPL